MAQRSGWAGTSEDGDSALDLVGPVDLDHHGDDDLDPRAVDGQLDLAVNVRLPRPPAWLQARLQAALTGLAAYPRPAAAVAAVAARHGATRPRCS